MVFHRCFSYYKAVAHLSNDITRSRNVSIQCACIVIDGDFIKTGFLAAAYFFGFSVKPRSFDGRKINDLRGLRHRRSLLEIRCDRKSIIRHHEK